MQIPMHVADVAGDDGGRHNRDSHSVAEAVRVHAAHVVCAVGWERVIKFRVNFYKYK